MGLFCELTKAIVSVRHELLTFKLEFYGVKGSILNWLKYYSHTRKQLLCKLSSHLIFYHTGEVVRYGLPQGSVLRPLPFSVYINDFLCIINKVTHTILFADDTNILVSSSDFNELNSKLNSILCCISKWFQNNQLVLNLNKTHIIKFASCNLTYPLNILYNN
jgi:hypothetical protein